MMTYLGVVFLGFVGVLLFQARGVFGAILSGAKMRAGDYDGALRRVRWMSLGIPNVATLHREGLILFLAGHPADAEPCFRKALGMVRSDSRYPRERLQASLGHTLVDLCRYGEAERCFQDAIEAGDVTGNSQDGLTESRVVQGVEAEQALDYAVQAIECSKRRPAGRVPGVYYANQAWALALLGRSAEARESLSQALAMPEPSAPGRASQHWHAGMVLLAMKQPDEALDHFQIGCDADPRGKYGRRCAEQLRLSTRPLPPSRSYPG
jgi:tetratricopeptide (TPR) repeat protein